MGGIAGRKDDHLDIVMAGGGAVEGKGAGFDRLRFDHVALPELDLDAIDLSVAFLGRTLRAPFLISSMTGGPARAAAINRHLVEAAETLGLAFAVGSQRIAIETGGNVGLTGALRRAARTIPLLSNLGAAQMVGADGLDRAKRAVEMIEADALIIHLNPLQEALQPEGDRNWKGVLAGVEATCRALSVPVVVKEVGAGLSGSVARRLVDAGVSVIDVAGSGGTSWAAVEGQRAATESDRAVAMAFADWGIPTAEAIAQVRKACPSVTVIGSGGIRTGIDAAKALALGADLVGQAAVVLEGAVASTDAVVDHFRTMICALQIACFCTGSANVAALRAAQLSPV
ncbi:type 2 isopentenyl-diphosphate Delta-isomerase [Chthonobacter albigriseus]|uniref:type 2 isopentenyl-diphosphate Delta-isomerase n=1 Tax=Chthonobacter albigriseus TaxID=1683161 RepID=UPI0015EF9621|nr:type 2 isopentenyl-diphosphate Delta-isomerase [Chthonobacter albigriseus]